MHALNRARHRSIQILKKNPVYFNKKMKKKQLTIDDDVTVT